MCCSMRPNASLVKSPRMKREVFSLLWYAHEYLDELALIGWFTTSECGANASGPANQWAGSMYRILAHLNINRYPLILERNSILYLGMCSWLALHYQCCSTAGKSPGPGPSIVACGTDPRNGPCRSTCTPRWSATVHRGPPVAHNHVL